VPACKDNKGTACPRGFLNGDHFDHDSAVHRVTSAGPVIACAGWLDVPEKEHPAAGLEVKPAPALHELHVPSVQKVMNVECSILYHHALQTKTQQHVQKPPFTRLMRLNSIASVVPRVIYIKASHGNPTPQATN